MDVDSWFFPEEIISKIVSCIEDAVGDDILIDIHRNDLRTTNSVPSRIWDLLNTNIFKSLDVESCTIVSAHRGPWEMIVVYEKTSQCIITFMREKRFNDLRNHQSKRTQMHYLDMLAKQFNKDLLADQNQMTLLPNSFSDEGRLAELVQNLLSDLGGDVPMVRNHVLVLFDTVGYRLAHIRAVKVTPELDIARGCDQDWTKFISAAESDVVEKVDNPELPENKPNRGLKLKPKATERQKNRPRLRTEEKKREENS